ncbi:tRNA (guanine(46)-N(7))-methyltransferase [hydrothermal vent metagenome]|uniref:tRNA (guanine(46)-N(7))-methyltransferase n=1 Tax=hydrothermal vent metagenome TaxID=652676 RepID=A0A3B0XKZ7_9ZZZZ
MLPKYPRTIHSFVKREGRLTQSQQQAIENQWPEFGVNFSEQLIDMPTLFGRDAETILEIGFGNGESLFQMAQDNPHKNFFGIEVHRPGVGHLLRLVEKTNCTNLHISIRDAIDVLEHQIADNSIDRLQLFFPDPWHKKKHNKRRIIQDTFIAEVARILTPDGTFHLATDWEHYAKHMLKTLNNSDLFFNLSEDQTFVPKPDERPTTKFERRGHKLGHGVWDLMFSKIS